MKFKTMKTQITVLLAASSFFIAVQTHAQNTWRTAGNNIQDGHHLGSNNNRSLIITTNGQDRMRVDSTGDIIMGQSAGPLHFLLFGTSFHMKFPQNQYIFRHSNSQEGLYRNQTLTRIEYRDQVSVPNMWLQSSSTGNSYFRGNMGIGTETPEGKLHVFRASAGTVTANANAPLVVENATSNYINLLTPSASESGILFGNNQNAQDGAIIYNNVNLADGLQFRTNGNVTRMSLTSAGNLGLGTPAPEANLHIFRGSAGAVTANANAPLVVENSTSNYINLITPDVNERGILFGDNLNAQDGGIIYTGGNQLQLRANGNVNRLIIDPDGNTGIGLDPAGFGGFNDGLLQVGNDGDDNLRLVANDGANDWSLFSANGTTGDLFLFKNGVQKGFFNDADGAYIASSDRRLKKDISELPTILESIMKLKPRKYHFMESANVEKYSYGFIAQEVNEVFPDFVAAYKDRKTGEERYGLNYENFGVIAIKAIQEQQKQLDEQKKAMDELRELVKQLSGQQATAANTSPATVKTVISDAVLEQNKPNPFKGITSIRYSLPGATKNAQLIVTDLSGKTVRQISLKNATTGTVNIDATMLSNGTYNYSLYADGKLIGSKKMILNH